MKHCTDCKYCSTCMAGAPWYRCTAPKAIAIHELALVDAEERPFCLDMRKDAIFIKYCGPDARWFEVKK